MKDFELRAQNVGELLADLIVMVPYDLYLWSLWFHQLCLTATGQSESESDVSTLSHLYQISQGAERGGCVPSCF